MSSFVNFLRLHFHGTRSNWNHNILGTERLHFSTGLLGTVPLRTANRTRSQLELYLWKRVEQFHTLLFAPFTMLRFCAKTHIYFSVFVKPFTRLRTEAYVYKTAFQSGYFQKRRFSSNSVDSVNAQKRICVSTKTF